MNSCSPSPLSIRIQGHRWADFTPVSGWLPDNLVSMPPSGCLLWWNGEGWVGLCRPGDLLLIPHSQEPSQDPNTLLLGLCPILLEILPAVTTHKMKHLSYKYFFLLRVLAETLFPPRHTPRQGPAAHFASSELTNKLLPHYTPTSKIVQYKG